MADSTKMANARIAKAKRGDGNTSQYEYTYRIVEAY